MSKNPLTGQEQKDVASPQHPESVEDIRRGPEFGGVLLHSSALEWSIS
jgi:hypothetical protein